MAFNALFLQGGLPLGEFFQFLVQVLLTVTGSHEYAACVNSRYDLCTTECIIRVPLFCECAH